MFLQMHVCFCRSIYASVDKCPTFVSGAGAGWDGVGRTVFYRSARSFGFQAGFLRGAYFWYEVWIVHLHLNDSVKIPSTPTSPRGVFSKPARLLRISDRRCRSLMIFRRNALFDFIDQQPIQVLIAWAWEYPKTFFPRPICFRLTVWKTNDDHWAGTFSLNLVMTWWWLGDDLVITWWWLSDYLVRTFVMTFVMAVWWWHNVLSVWCVCS